MTNHINKEIRIPIEENEIHLTGHLTVPAGSECIVIFAHGSGSSRFSPRNRYVASALQKRGIATLLTDLLTPAEDEIFDKRFDIDLLTERLIAVTEYIQAFPDLRGVRIGYFGASTGAASALNAASRLHGLIGAVVSRGGRPDLATHLPAVKAPTLLIVGSMDTDVIDMNRGAFRLLHCEKKMVIVEGASHLFEEEGKLEEVADLAIDWFETFLMTDNIGIAKRKAHIL